MTSRKCEECDRPVRSTGLCDMHRQRRRTTLKKVNLCACGCGGLTGYKYLPGHHMKFASREEQTRRARLNDGATQRDRGSGKSYRKIRGQHEHRLVASRMLGRALQQGEIVPHVNGDKRDNRPENLRVMTQAEHIKEHRQELRAAQEAKRRS